MKFCTCIAEYNPFHLGHAKLIDYMKNTLDVENIIVVMSGNFTERGEGAILDKYERAKHAVMAGADLVIELPTVFATANAEVFAKGGVKIMQGLGVSEGLCFGVESGDKDSFIALANMLNDESKEFKKALKEQLSNGVSLAKAKIEALKKVGKEFDDKLISSPNNILGLEYTKAILDYKEGKKDNKADKKEVEIYPFIREGDHNDGELKKGITSATSIRQAIKEGKLKKTKKSLPPFVYNDLKDYPEAFDKLITSALIKTTTEELATRPDCTEGLENRIKALSKDNYSVEQIVAKATTKRYHSARIRRILVANFLGITKEFTLECMKEDLYAKVLAVNSEKMGLISEISKKATIPLLTRKSDVDNLKDTAKKCFEIDALAQDLYNLATGSSKNENYMLKV